MYVLGQGLIPSKVQPPAGFWDPLGFTKGAVFDTDRWPISGWRWIVPLISENLEGGDAASFRRRRYVELKHGRVPVAADQWNLRLKCTMGADKWTECTVWLSCSDIDLNTSLNSLNAHNAHNPVISISFDRWPCSLALATSFLSTTAGQETCLLPLAWSSAHLGCKKDFETWQNYWCQD